MSKLVQLKRVTDWAWGRSHHPPEAMGVWGEAHSWWAVFCKFLGKNGSFNVIWITFCTFSEPFESQLNKSLSSLTGQVQDTFKILHFGVKFCDLAWSGNQSTLLSATLLALNYSLEDLPLKIFVWS